MSNCQSMKPLSILSEAASIYRKALQDGISVSEIFTRFNANQRRPSRCNAFTNTQSADDSNFYPESQQKHYSPPERWENNSLEINEQIVVYQLACLFFQLLEGKPPFIGDDQEEQHKEENTLGLEGIPKAADKLIIKSLSKKPSKRPDLQKFASALRSFTKHKAVYTAKSGSGSFTKILLVLLLAGGGFFGYDHFVIGKKKKKRSLLH